MLSLKDVDKRFKILRKTTVVADSLDLLISDQDIVALVGPSGSGKSTVGRMLLNLEDPDRGTVLLDGLDIRSMNSEQRNRYRRSVQMVPQHPDAAFNPRRTIDRSLREVFLFHQVCSKNEQEHYLLATLDHVRIHRQLLKRYPHELSGGELQRFAIARAILTKPRFLVLDEVTSMLDVSVQAAIIKMLLELREQHPMGYLFITHNLSLAAAFCTRIVLLNQGRLKSCPM